MNSNDDPDMYISIARDFSIGMVLVLLCLHRIAQDMNERQQRPTPTPPEMGNEVLNASVGAEELDPQPNTPTHATPEPEILSGVHGNRSQNPRTNCPPLPTVLRTHGNHAYLAPHVFHEMPAPQNPRGHQDAPGHIPSTYVALRSPNESVNRDMVSQQEPAELTGVESTQGCGNTMPPVELPSETNSQDTKIQVLMRGSIPGETAGDTRKTKLKTKLKTSYQKLHHFLRQRKSQSK
ncbi:hypothetical protein BDZ91DRAFT_713500 [Kalaharituber pfeilii]|nr:hypothetical protein BDZ91DRAFT_713500 [Kalaharituber pfeilii]